MDRGLAVAVARVAPLPSSAVLTVRNTCKLLRASTATCATDVPYVGPSSRRGAPRGGSSLVGPRRSPRGSSRQPALSALEQPQQTLDELDDRLAMALEKEDATMALAVLEQAKQLRGRTPPPAQLGEKLLQCEPPNDWPLRLQLYLALAKHGARYCLLVRAGRLECTACADSGPAEAAWRLLGGGALSAGAPACSNGGRTVTNVSPMPSPATCSAEHQGHLQACLAVVQGV